MALTKLIDKFRTKSWRADGNLYIRTRYFGAGPNGGSGWQYGSIAHINLPFANLTVSLGHGPYPSPSVWYVCPGDPSYTPDIQTFEFPGTYNAHGGEFVGGLTKTTQVDANLQAINPLTWEPCVPLAYPGFISEYDIAVPFSVEVTGTFDLWGEEEDIPDGAATPCGISPDSTLPDLYCYRLPDRSSTWLLGRRLTLRERVTPTATDEHGDYGYVTVTYNVDGNVHTKQVKVYSDVWADDNIMSCHLAGATGFRGCPGGVAVGPMATVTFSRTFSDGACTHTYDGVWDDYMPDAYGNPTPIRGRVVVSGDTISLYGDLNWDDHYAVTHQDFIACTFYDRAGAHTSHYGGHLKYADGTAASGVQMMLREGMKPTYHPPDDTSSIGRWLWDTPVVFTDSTDVTWGGWWQMNSPIILDETSGPYYIQAGEATYIDLPNEPAGNEPMISEGLISIVNLESLGEPVFDLDNDGNIELSNPDYEYADCRVLLEPGIAQDVFHWDAAQISVGLGPDGTSDPILDWDGTGWTKSRVDLDVSSWPYTPGGVQVDDAMAGDWISRTYSDPSLRLTGTAFAKVRWRSAQGGSIELYINGHKWILSASSGGDHETIIDLCRPDCTAEPGGSGGTGSLQARASDGALLYIESTGALAAECCCGEKASCAEAAQVQSVIPIELPRNAFFPPATGTPVHGHELGSGWGIGRVVEVKIGFPDAGDWTISDLRLYRKPSEDHGFVEVWITPQGSFNNNRVAIRVDGMDGAIEGAGDAGLFYSGFSTDTTHEMTYYEQRIGIVVVDGAVVGEITLGGPYWIDGITYPGWKWLFHDLTAGPMPCFPWDDYETPTRHCANGVGEVVRLAPPSNIPSAFAAYLDPRYGTHIGVEGLTLTATYRCDAIQTPVGFGSVIGGIHKVLGGLITGIAFNGARRASEVYVQIDSAGPDTQLVQTNKLGWFTALVKTTEDATVYGATANITVSPRNRHHSRVIVEV